MEKKKNNFLIDQYSFSAEKKEKERKNKKAIKENVILLAPIKIVFFRKPSATQNKKNKTANNRAEAKSTPTEGLSAI